MEIVMKKNVIYQKFLDLPGHPLYPYPPLVLEPDTDYICFTTMPLQHSSYWKIIEVKSYFDEEIKKILDEYEQSYEVYHNQIIIGPLFQEKKSEWESLVVIPDLYALPEVPFDKRNFTPTKDENGKYLYSFNPTYSDGPYDGRKFLLTIGVPISNQIATIERCLSHIKPLLEQVDSELLVVNTGSTDGTLDVCKAYGARIVEFPWCDNMSAARNTGIYHALGEWYMSIDDDEWFDDVSEIVSFFQKGIYKEYDIAYYIQRNYRTLEGEEYYDVSALRMAKIVPELHFEGRIHDALLTRPVAGGVRMCQLDSYAYHYGFAKGDAAKTKEKYKRNMSCLLYDVYEYPDDLRHNYQMANEMEVQFYNKEVYAYYLRGLSIDQEKKDRNFGKKHAIHLISILYAMNHTGIFKMAKTFEKKYSFTDMEKAYINFLQAALKLKNDAASREILSYYYMYEHFKKQSEKHPKENFFSELGRECCTNEKTILDGKVIAFCAYCKQDEKEKVLALLKEIEIDQIVDGKDYFCRYFLLASKSIYTIVWERFPKNIPEDWAEALLIGALWILVKSEEEKEEQQHRISELLKKISLSKLGEKIERAWERVGKYLGEEPVGVSFWLSLEGLTIQAAFFYRYLLKKRLNKMEIGEERRGVFQAYIQLGSFIATSYYSSHLLQEEDCIIASDILAAYQIFSAWKVLNDKKTALSYLKKAEQVYPDYKDDIEDCIREENL